MAGAQKLWDYSVVDVNYLWELGTPKSVLLVALLDWDQYYWKKHIHMPDVPKRMVDGPIDMAPWKYIYVP
jgi:hypothetical protein